MDHCGSGCNGVGVGVKVGGGCSNDVNNKQTNNKMYEMYLRVYIECIFSTAIQHQVNGTLGT